MPDQQPLPTSQPGSPFEEPSDQPAKQQAAADSQPAGDSAKTANAAGNILLLLILLCLISIPFLVHFTDTGARTKREIHSILESLRGQDTSQAVPHGAAPANPEKLLAAQERISTLESELVSVKEQLVKAESAAAEAQAPPPPPEEDTGPPVLPRREYDVAKLFNGVGVKTTLDLRKGANAAKERLDDEAYQYEVKLKINVPEPNRSLDELAALNANLPNILPKLGELLGSSQVSPLFGRLYGEKHKRIKRYVTRLDRLETRHNYFDCETVLHLTDPATSQKVLLMQGEMDVVADGSDGDRMPEVEDYISLSRYYQPTTSYGWPKKTRNPNPLLARLEKELNDVVEEYKIRGLPRERNAYLVRRRDELRRLIPDLKGRSFLIAEADPFIVLPLSFLGLKSRISHAPATGDYAVVIHGDKVFPAICGDAGPSWKLGEGSLFLAKTINPKASPYYRPESDLVVTYLVFPGSAESSKQPPDLAKWTAKCRDLLDRMGGLGEGFSLYAWRDIVAERRAVRESKALLAAAQSELARAESSFEAVEKNLLEAKKQAEAAQRSLDGAGPEADVNELKVNQGKALAVLARAQVVANDALASLNRTREAVPKLRKAAEEILELSQKPYPTPRSETTDLILTRLQQSQSLLQ